jgi:outer membrane protein OmpA-like peptidoglycan-associated protein
MRRLRLWWSLFIALLAAGPAFGQITGTPIEFSGRAGIFSPDARSRANAGPGYEFSAGYRFQSWLVAEGYALFAPTKADTIGEPTVNFSSYGLDLRFNLRPGEGRVVPFLLTGFGVGRSNVFASEPDVLERGAPSIGMGALFSFRQDPRLYIRFQVRDLFFRERDALEFSNQMGASLGLHYVWGGKPKDIDLDGVRDWLDTCPATPIGAKVDAHGCPIDSDHDGVFDGIDKCEGTPAGAKVDKDGCPIDSDGDGVPDGIDQCADTPKGATVDARGCPSDADRDSVFDGIDQCPNTPAGCVVDENGCPKDSDGDGVCDGVDQCPDTSPDLRVDAKGCPLEISIRETELLDTGMMRFNDIQFETNKSDLLPESLPTLDLVGQILSQWPDLRIEIGGHTDSRGSDAKNQALSEARARTVKAYLLQKFPNLDPKQYVTRGYGESRPLDPGQNEAAWARNRRVEFVVLNKDVLKREIERRRLVPKEEAAPADTSKKE